MSGVGGWNLNALFHNRVFIHDMYTCCIHFIFRHWICWSAETGVFVSTPATTKLGLNIHKQIATQDS